MFLFAPFLAKNGRQNAPQSAFNLPRQDAKSTHVPAHDLETERPLTLFVPTSTASCKHSTVASFRVPRPRATKVANKEKKRLTPLRASAILVTVGNITSTQAMALGDLIPVGSAENGQQRSEGIAPGGSKLESTRCHQNLRRKVRRLLCK